MSETKVSFKVCPKFQKTFGILGKKWNGLIIEVLLNEGPQRFKELAQKVEKCSDRVLVERLKELEKEDLVERITPENSARAVYQLTVRGEDLRDIMQDIHIWSEKWYSLEDCN
ncbi:winged helix-turn-helix transcriptional regulator [Ligilactobacillus faecis]|uniref:winged helix-turn-helix transcriptional regulator n=1 Tax=Ligilactobacillus faecis TaxID=762833 RepID=UPI00246910C1|nr:helix-turn-helix domain-containing protein [Ligilactobacillus faecis]WGN89077.1 helix-turn-helix domain-containing protein [Ligilactobacillus faecis]